MAFGRRKDTSGGSFSRYQEDENDILKQDGGSRDTRPPRRIAGYGVSDSYYRQNEFRRQEDSSREYGRQAEQLRGEYGRQAEQTRGGYDGSQAARRPRKWENDPYDDRYTGSYDSFYEQTGERYIPDGQNGNNMRTAAKDRPAGGRRDARADRSPADRRDRTSSHPVRHRSRAGKKSAFVVKLILLIIAAALVFLMYRFSRMDRVHLGNILKNEGASVADGYRNFVIYGVDSRDGQLTKDAHSDTIVILSISKSSNEAKMVSVYRDTYLDNTNGEYRKATECYFFGGPKRSVNMLNKNFDLNIGDYIAVDFNAVVKAVDLIGGVDINVTEEELPYINGYQTENAQVTGAEITPVTSAGYQHLNGIQALAYCRIRYTAGYDFKRTERQRDVLTQIFDSAKKQGTTKMLQVADAMMPYISTSFSNAEIMSLVTDMSNVTLGDSAGFPFEQQAANIQAGDCVVPVNLSQNVAELHAFLFGQNDYTPSETVQEISQQIVNNTGIA